MGNSDNSNSNCLEINASIVFQLGESLISDPVQALVELVKNAYDADAGYANVVIETAKKNDMENTRYPDAKGYIMVTDNGHGMSSTAIKEGWLTISNSLKRKMKEKGGKTKKKRTPLGDKGLGRFGAQRLGYNLEIFTKPENEDVEYHVALSWRDFENKDKLGDVPVYIEKIPPTRKKGTTLLISDIKEPDYFKEREQEKKKDDSDSLKVALSRMISPYEEIEGFYVAVKLDDKDLDLAAFRKEVLKGSQVHYDIDFDEKKLTLKGRSRLSFIRPRGKEDRELFRELVEFDNGDEFFNYLFSEKEKEAKSYKLKKSQEDGWFVEYERTKPFEDFDGMEYIDIDLNGKKNPVRANPGRFNGKIDSFDLTRDGADRQNIFDTASNYKQYLKDLSGIRVYRDGFGIRVDKDWLELGKQQTSGGSYYGLRVENTLGYIALTAEHNQNLEETTNREGFKKAPYYNNFYEMLKSFVQFSGKVQEFLRREWNEFKRDYLEKTAGVKSETTAEDLSERIGEKLSKASQYHTSANNLKVILTEKAGAARNSIDNISKSLPDDFGGSAELKEAIKSLGEHIADAGKLVGGIDTYLQEIYELGPVEKVLKDRFGHLKEQSEQLFETASLGLTAEALSHEIANITDRLAGRCTDIHSYIKSQNRKDSRIFAFLEHVDTSISALRKQLSHLAPSLKYVREKREKIEIYPFCREIAYHHRDRMKEKNIDIQVTPKKEKNFYVDMNRGKLNQVFDNLFLNSDYWLCEDISTRNIRQGRVTITIEKPFVRFFDNGRGVDPSVETTLFEPFVTAKGKGMGRGLGLFIIRQLLDAEGCTISLLPERNTHNRLYIFEIDFSGGMDDK
jgi:hypothetical protein